MLLSNCIFLKKILGLFFFWTGTVKTDRKVKGKNGEKMRKRAGSQTPTRAGCSAHPTELNRHTPVQSCLPQVNCAQIPIFGWPGRFSLLFSLLLVTLCPVFSLFLYIYLYKPQCLETFICCMERKGRHLAVDREDDKEDTWFVSLLNFSDEIKKQTKKQDTI